MVSAFSACERVRAGSCWKILCPCSWAIIATRNLQKSLAILPQAYDFFHSVVRAQWDAHCHAHCYTRRHARCHACCYARIALRIACAICWCDSNGRYDGRCDGRCDSRCDGRWWMVDIGCGMRSAMRWMDGNSHALSSWCDGDALWHYDGRR